MTSCCCKRRRLVFAGIAFLKTKKHGGEISKIMMINIYKYQTTSCEPVVMLSKISFSQLTIVVTASLC